MAKEDLAWCVRRIPSSLKDAMLLHGNKICIGGGFVRSCITGDDLKDVDVFTNSSDTADTVSAILAKEFKYKTVKTHNAITLLRNKGVPLQFIYRWVYERPEDTLNDFDFTICCSSIWYDGSTDAVSNEQSDGWKGVVHDMFYQDLAAKRLRYTHPDREEEAGGSAIRLLKYYRKGYKVTLKSYAGIIARVAGAVEGVRLDENILTETITGLLVEVDPSAVTEEVTLMQGE